jgi:hypothetical protein
VSLNLWAMQSKLDNGGWSAITPDDYRMLIEECYRLNHVVSQKDERIVQLNQTLSDIEAEAND